MKIDLYKFVNGKQESLCAPATIGGWTYATNGQIIIRVPFSDGCALHTPPPKFPSMDRLPWDHANLDGWVDMPDISGLENEECPVCSGSGHVLICPECSGVGVLHFSNFYNEYDVECKTCGGEEEIPGGENDVCCTKCKSTGKVFAEIYVGWHRGKVNPHYVLMLSALDNVEFSTHGDINEVIRFRFDGGEGLLMPIYTYEDTP